ncbi:polysaccharide deacetylase family protein [Candidatus Sumerlaeota bacterium]|nr:polysaccharide deacetylase family protein [Candidatus Sumerlaeota bacterium]
MSAAIPGFVQVDVDGLWAVRECYGRAENGTFTNDPCWTEGVARLDDVFQRTGTEAAFFIVGRDMELDAKRRATRKLLHRGYELGNHGYTHRLGLTLETTGGILREITQGHRALAQLGAKPSGFRAPGYDVDSRVLKTLVRCGYDYDASLLPTYAGPLLRATQALLAGKWIGRRRQYGRISFGRAPRRPYIPRLYKVRKPRFEKEEKRIVEIPVGVTPVLKLPLTASALFPMSRDRVRDLFRKMSEQRRPVLLLLHAIDGTDCSRPIVFDSKRPRVAGFRMSGDAKEKQLRMIVEEFAGGFAVTRADEFARQMLAHEH